jgi:MFS family permease
VTFFTLLAAAGARATPGVILLPLGNEFQWSRATVSSIVSINIFLYGLIGPFAAALYQRFGLRRTMMTAMALLTTGYGLSTVATQYWQFVVLWGFVVGAGSGLAATVLGAAVANRWFTERRGLVMGLLTASDGPVGFPAEPGQRGDVARQLARGAVDCRGGHAAGDPGHLVADAR